MFGRLSCKGMAAQVRRGSYGHGGFRSGSLGMVGLGLARSGVVGLGLAVKVGIYEEWIEPIRRGKAVMDGKCVDGLGPMCNGEAV